MKLDSIFRVTRFTSYIDKVGVIMSNSSISQEMKSFIVSYLKSQPFTNGSNDKVDNIKNSINFLTTKIQEFKDKINGLKTVESSGLLTSVQLEELRNKVKKETEPLEMYKTKLAGLQNELQGIENNRTSKYRLMDANLRNSYMTPDGSPAWLMKQGFLGLLSALENFDVLEREYRNVDTDAIELGIKAAITHHYTERSSKSGRMKYVSRFHLEDSTNAVKESLNERLAEIISLLR